MRPSRLNRLIALVAPPRCTACGRDCEPDRWICIDCVLELRSKPSGHGAAFVNEGIARELVLALKFQGRVALAREMAQLMHERMGGVLASAEWIVPAPSHPQRRRQRGYEPATLLARSLAELTGIRCVECLARDGSRRPQSELTRRQRLSLPPATITVSSRALRQAGIDPLAEFPTNVVLCDEVRTTGVTLEVCAQAIRDRQPGAGHRQIRSLTFASTGAHGSTDRIVRRQSRRARG